MINLVCLAFESIWSRTEHIILILRRIVTKASGILVDASNPETLYPPPISFLPLDNRVKWYNLDDLDTLIVDVFGLGDKKTYFDHA